MAGQTIDLRLVLRLALLLALARGHGANVIFLGSVISEPKSESQGPAPFREETVEPVSTGRPLTTTASTTLSLTATTAVDTRLAAFLGSEANFEEFSRIFADSSQEGGMAEAGGAFPSPVDEELRLGETAETLTARVNNTGGAGAEFPATATAHEQAAQYSSGWGYQAGWNFSAADHAVS